jgi:tRNA U34 2-thiouridine synthase MnmA/TrmU
MSDPSVAHLQMPLREVKAIRLMIYDETKGMTSPERTAYYNDSVKRAQEKGFKLKIVNLRK